MTTNEVLKKFSPRKIIYPILITLAVVGYFLYKEIDSIDFSQIQWTSKVFIGLSLAVLMMIFRDLAYMYRIRALTNRHLSWKRSFIVIMLWEFASAISPSIVGGTAFALILLAKEGIKTGKSTAIVFLSAFLDELFFIVMAPLVLFAVSDLNINPNYLTWFWIGYGILFVYTAFLAYGFLINASVFRKIIIGIFSLGFLKRWKKGAIKAGDDVLTTSEEIKKKKPIFWIEIIGSTFVSWTARYFTINFILYAFAGDKIKLAFGDHILIYAKQVVMWVVLLISPTPGGSGIAEKVFQDFLIEYVAYGVGFALILANIWRLMSYWLYLLIGAIIMPRWIKAKFSK